MCFHCINYTGNVSSRKHLGTFKYCLKHKAQPSVLYLIKHELRVFWIASKTIHFIPIFSLCLRKNFQYRCRISGENRGKSFVKIYVCFITFKDSFTAMILFVFCSWNINDFWRSFKTIIPQLDFLEISPIKLRVVLWFVSQYFSSLVMASVDELPTKHLKVTKLNLDASS